MASGAKSKYTFNSITLALLYHQVEMRNRKLSQFIDIRKPEKVCLIYLGWMDMSGKRPSRKELHENKFTDTVIQKLIKQGHISHAFKPIQEGRRFFYQVVHEVCLFFMKYGKHGLRPDPEGIEVDINEVKKIC